MRTSRLAVGLVVVASAIRVALAVFIPPLPDETYYWEWSRHLAFGYFDHPPAISLLIHAGTTIFGATALGIRASAVLAGAIATAALVVMSRRLDAPAELTPGDSIVARAIDDPGARAALLMLVVPGALIGFVLATPDAPLLAAVALTLAALERVVASPPRSRESLGWWCAAGIALGLAFCSKLTSVLIPFGVCVALLSRRDLRTRFAEPGPYVATVIALLLFAPTLVWNSHHGWISFAYQLGHGFGRTRGSVLGRELGLIGGQLGIISPIIAVMIAIAAARALHAITDARKYMLAVIAVTVAAFFAISAGRRRVEPNWPVPALIAALPLLATMRLSSRARKWLAAGSILGAICTVAVVAQALARVIPVAPGRDPMTRARGWDDLALAVQRAGSAAHGCSTTWVAADRYQEASELAFNLPGKPHTFALNLGGRPNQYDLWPGIYSLAAATDCALVVVDEGSGGEHVVHSIGADSTAFAGHAVMTWRGATVGRRAIWIVRGIPDAPPVEAELSPAAAAALSSTNSDFASHASALDSIVALYRLGPAPGMVTLTTSAPIADADRREEIDTRVDTVQQLLRHSGFSAVYRDARYHECTFVRLSRPDSTEVGYVHAPDGCKLTSGHGDRVLRVEHALGPWYSYAAPERHDR